MSSFYSLGKLLGSLPFSIRGRDDHVGTVDQFFHRLCESEFIARADNVEVVSYSLAKLEDPDTWETASHSKGYFFHALNEKYTLLALNIYSSLRDELFGLVASDYDQDKNGYRSQTVAIALSRLFIRDVGFRVAYSNEGNWRFGLYEQNNHFTIKIPLAKVLATPSGGLSLEETFQSAITSFLSEAIDDLTENPQGLENLLLQKISKAKFGEGKVKYDSDTDPLKTPRKRFRGVFKEKEELCEFREELVRAILFWDSNNKGYFIGYDTENRVRDWVELFFPIVFLSFVYRSWFEYFPSVCGLRRQGDTVEQRNIGGLVLGYKLSKNLSLDERSAFRLISGRITGVVAAQYLYERSVHAQIELSRSKFKDFCQLLDENGFTDNCQENSTVLDRLGPFLHGNQTCLEGFKTVSGLVSQYLIEVGTPFSEWLESNDAQKRFSKYLTIVFSPTAMNGHNREWGSELCKDASCAFCLMLSGRIGDIPYYLNLPLLNKILFEFDRERVPTISFADPMLSFSYSHDLNVGQLLERLRFAKTGSFTGTIKDNHLAILAMSNMYIRSDNTTIFDLEQWALRKDTEAVIEKTTVNHFSLDFEFKIPSRER